MRPQWGVTIVLLCLGLGFARPVLAADGIDISQPAGGAALQGQIAILGTSALADFASVEVSFAYSQEKVQAWFPINDSQDPVTGGLLANWDTTTLTDGVYILRLSVTLKDGSRKVAVVKGVRVRNYTAVETSTPTITPTAAPVLVTATPTPTQAPTGVRPEPTPLPTNPAAVSQGEIGTNFLRGVGVVFLLFASLGLYLIVRARIIKR
jgi:hypothetical protein